MHAPLADCGSLKALELPGVARREGTATGDPDYPARSAGVGEARRSLLASPGGEVHGGCLADGLLHQARIIQDWFSPVHPSLHSELFLEGGGAVG